MNIGMLWHDDDPQRTLEQKLKRAADYYQSKYGQRPTTCFVNSGIVPVGQSSTVAGLRVQSARTVLPNHFWLGVESN